MKPTKQHTPPTVLVGIQRELGGKIKQQVAYDANVCTTEMSAGQIRVTSGSPFTHALRLKYQARPVLLSANDWEGRLQFPGETQTGVFTVNRSEQTPGFVSKPAGSRTIDTKSYKIFTQDGDVSPTQESVLSGTLLASLLRDIEALKESEGIHFHNSGLDLYLWGNSTDRWLKAIDACVRLIKTIETEKVLPEFHSLPAKFKTLIPLIHEWAIYDDPAREDAIENASEALLTKLVDSVEPYLPEINSFLDSFPGGQPNEDASALARLAECACEARLRLFRLTQR